MASVVLRGNKTATTQKTDRTSLGLFRIVLIMAFASLSFLFFCIAGTSFICQALVIPAPPSSIASKWLSICTKLQDPDLYDALTWTRSISMQGEHIVVVGATEANTVKEGDILSLYPVHAIGYTVENKDYIICDTETFVKDRSYRLDMQHSCHEHFFFIQGDPTQPHIPGWLGHLPRVHSKTTESNCCILPLTKASPLFALVATGPIRSGQPLVLRESLHDPGLSKIMERRYAGEIRELVTYLNMALPTETVTQTQTTPAATTESSRTRLQHPFQNINQSYKGLTQIHTEPDIYIIPGFLSTAECDRIIAKVQPHLIPCLVKNPVTGQVESDTTTRTSSNANVPQREVPTLVHKLTQLLDCSSEQLEILQVLHYQRGQYFSAHTDGFEGPTTACGFEQSGRLVTVFCYLNHAEEGGQTRFPGLELDIVPQQGMAVLHFPTTLGLEEDGRTEHEGLPAVDDKWLLVTWMWMHERSEAQYAESVLSELSRDII